MKKQIFIVAVLAGLMAASHSAFDKWEEQLRKPHHFVFDLSKVEWPNTKPGVPSPTFRDEDIEEVNLAGTFNDWADPNSYNSQMDGHAGWPLAHTGKNRWELTAAVPRGTHTYKFRVTPRNRNILKSFSGGVNPKFPYVWVHDPGNPHRQDDSFGGFNSLLEIKSVRAWQQGVTLLFGAMIALVLFHSLFQMVINAVLQVQVPFYAKLSLLSVFFILVFSALSISAGIYAVYRVYLNESFVTANMITQIAAEDIVGSLRKSGRIRSSRDIEHKSLFSKMFRKVPGIESGFYGILVYNREGHLVQVVPSSHWISRWEQSPEYEAEFFRRSVSQIPDWIVGRTVGPGMVPRSFLDGSAWPSRITGLVRDLVRIAGGGELPIYFVFPLRSSRELHGYLVLELGERGGLNASPSARWQNLASILKMSPFVLTGALLIGVMVSFVFSRMWMRPLRTLIAGLRQVRLDDLTGRMDMQTGDEFQLAADVFNDMVKGLREKELIKGAFGRYVSKQVAEKILKDPERMDMAGERREVTILFADIRNFTPYSETHTPEEVVHTLNQYFSVMIDVIFEHEGTLDKFIGDCVMAVFGAPLDQPDHAERAVRCAWKMQQVLGEFNRTRAERGELPVRIGIGVNSGVAVSGNLGSKKRTEFSVVGDAVNLASRLEDLAGEGQILIGPQTYEKAKNLVEVRALPSRTVKGKTDPLNLYEVVALINPPA